MKFLFWLFKKTTTLIFKSHKKDPGYIIRMGNGVYLQTKDKKTKEIYWEDIIEELGANPIADEMKSIIEESIIESGIAVKYRCTKCQETLVDDLNELTSYGGLGNWCEHCIAKADAE